MLNTITILAFLMLAGSFCTSALITAIVRKRSLKKDFVARPAIDRYHTSVIPLGGGIAIFWTLAIFMLTGVAIVKFLIVPGHLDFLGANVAIHTEGFLTKIPELLIILACALILHVVGLWDDKKHLGPFVKLTAQIAVATIAAVFADIRVEFFIENKIFTTCLSVLWIVTIINAFNFLDNMDGLSAGIAAIVSAVLFTAAAISGQVFIGSLALLFIGALAGFLAFNFPPAKIFMGDCGSLVIGFILAVLTLRTTYYQQDSQGSGGIYAIFMPLVVMAVPLYDFLSVTILRIAHGKSPFVGDTQHFSHRLKRRGLTDTQTVLTLYLATVTTAASSIILYQVNLAGTILIFAQTVMILTIIAILETTGKQQTDL